MKSITDQIEEIKCEICDKYCKHPQVYTGDHKDEEDDYLAKMINEKCDKCPLCRL